MHKLVNIHDPMRITTFTKEQVEEIIPTVSKVTSKYLKNRDKLLKIMSSPSVSVNRRKILDEIQMEYNNWSMKIGRLGGRVVSELGKVRFHGEDCFYFWETGEKVVMEVYFK